MAAVARSLGLIASGGTDYHGDGESYAEALAETWIPRDVAERVRARPSGLRGPSRRGTARAPAPAGPAGAAAPLGIGRRRDERSAAARPRARAAGSGRGETGRPGGGRARRRVPAGGPGAAPLLDVDAGLPDEPLRLRGDGRPPAGRRLRRGPDRGGSRPGRHQHLCDPRGGGGQGDRPAGRPAGAEGGKPEASRRPHRVRGARAGPGGPGPPLPGRGPVPPPRRRARARRAPRPRFGPGRGRNGPGDRRDDPGQGRAGIGGGPPVRRASRGDRRWSRAPRVRGRRLAADHLRLRQDVHLLHRAVQSRPRAEPTRSTRWWGRRGPSPTPAIAR